MSKMYWKRILFVIAFALNLICIFQVAPKNTSVQSYTLRYDVNAPNMSESEINQYYTDHQIFPSTPPSGTDDKIVGEVEVAPHLVSRYPEYTTWYKTSIGSNSVASTYNGEPLEISESNVDIQAAKTIAGITYDYIGCGPLAMVSQLDYFARFAGYTTIATDPDDTYEKRLLAAEIFDNTTTIPSDSPLFEFLGLDLPSGTFTFPASFINGVRTVLENHYLAIPKIGVDEEGENYTYYDEDSQIIAYGDTLPSLNSFSTKISNIKDSIDRGMPVVWWTFGEAGEFSNHYMNIFGYETWIGTDSLGNTTTHLMFKLRFNWSYSLPIYMDSDLLDAVNGGFIFFEETHDKALFNPIDYGYECQYFFYEVEKNVTSSIGNKTFYTNRLRTGYINHYDDTNSYIDAQYLVLSAKRTGAGVAFLEYESSQAIEWVYFDARWWSSDEGISIYSGEALFQYKDSNGNWVTAIDLQRDIPYPYLSTIEGYPTKLQYRFSEPIYEFRFYVESFYPTGDRNKGRLVIGELNVFFIQTNS